MVERARRRKSLVDRRAKNETFNHRSNDSLGAELIKRQLEDRERAKGDKILKKKGVDEIIR